ncbi:hypothetical protein ORI89_16210 [Sphingobacterium sp. UT-1RO-CII-1]|uniref:hypothetical protein n=1 Tax=Sphingobacterium sp. UT-1RO-CII-1 TaxID=2995225 RepID=UPI00227C396E|nr:hypothetical protein [Sphingobacterium sp. UT-1RO-CII-1]MCY4781207.1 hypothetical protein [Sphingobacterium sp. UT-1RO-CII-1]
MNSSSEEKVVEKTAVLAQQAWIEVEALTNSEDPTDLNVKSGPSTSPPNSPDCNITNAGKPCAAHLSFPGALPPTSIPTGTTLQDLMDDYGATLVLDDEEKPEFTRKDQ